MRFLNVGLWNQGNYMNACPCLSKAIWFVYFMLHNINLVIWGLNLLYREFPKRIFWENFMMLYCCMDYKKVTRDKNFCQWRFFLFVFRLAFSSSESYFLNYKKLYRVCFYRNIGNFFGISIPRNKWKVFFWQKIKHFLILEPESSISPNISKLFRGSFSGFVFIFQVWVQEVH